MPATSRVSAVVLNHYAAYPPLPLVSPITSTAWRSIWSSKGITGAANKLH
jgi:hypothetical protein